MYTSETFEHFITQLTEVENAMGAQRLMIQVVREYSAPAPLLYDELMREIDKTREFADATRGTLDKALKGDEEAIAHYGNRMRSFLDSWIRLGELKAAYEREVAVVRPRLIAMGLPIGQSSSTGPSATT